jgi:hypothetical protein
MINPTESDVLHADRSRPLVRLCRSILLARSRYHGIDWSLQGQTLHAIRPQKHDAVRECLPALRERYDDDLHDVLYPEGRPVNEVAIPAELDIAQCFKGLHRQTGLKAVIESKAILSALANSAGRS